MHLSTRMAQAKNIVKKSLPAVAAVAVGTVAVSAGATDYATEITAATADGATNTDNTARNIILIMGGMVGVGLVLRLLGKI